MAPTESLGVAADGGDDSAISTLTERAEAVGINPDDYDTWVALEGALGAGTAAKATTSKTKSVYNADEDDRVEAVHKISDTEVMVVRADGKPALRCHPDDVQVTLDQQDDPTTAPAGTK